jgi:hypothetical protein
MISPVLWGVASSQAAVAEQRRPVADRQFLHFCEFHAGLLSQAVGRRSLLEADIPAVIRRFGV